MIGVWWSGLTLDFVQRTNILCKFHRSMSDTINHSILVRGVDPPDGADRQGGAPRSGSRQGGARQGGAEIPEDAMPYMASE